MLYNFRSANMETTWKLTPMVVVHSRPMVQRVSYAKNRIAVLIFTFFIYTSYHLSRKPISVVKSVLYQKCNVTSAECVGSWKPFDGPDYQSLLGSLDYAYLFAYAIGMFVSGHIAERTNLRHFLVLGMVSSGLCTALFGLGRYWDIHNLSYFLIVQIFGGLFQSSGWPAVVTCVANWFGKGRRGLVMGLWNSHTSIGNILGSLIAGFFVEYNWGLSFIIPGLIIGLLAVPVMLFLVPHPRELGLELPDDLSKDEVIDDKQEKEFGREAKPLLSTDENRPSAISFMRALRIPGVIEFSLCLFFAKLVSYTFLFWLPSYIENTAHWSPGVSAYLSTLFDVGGIIGGIFAGVVSDYLGGRALTCLVMLFFAAPTLFIYDIYGSVNLAANIVLLVICGALVNGPYCLITTAVSADLGTHPSLQGNAMALATVTAIIDGTGSMGAALGPLLTGLISPYGWRNVFYMLIFADLCALVISGYIYITYDRKSTSPSGPLLNGIGNNDSLTNWFARCRFSVRSAFIRVTLIQWLSVSFVFLLVTGIYVVFSKHDVVTRESR